MKGHQYLAVLESEPRRLLAIEVGLFKASRTVLEDTEGPKADMLVAGPKTVLRTLQFPAHWNHHKQGSGGNRGEPNQNSIFQVEFFEQGTGQLASEPRKLQGY